MFGKRLLQHRDDLGGVVDRQRGLGHESEVVRILRGEGRGVLGGLDQGHRARRQLPERADHFRVMGMPDQEDFAAALEMDRRLPVHFRHQRTGRIQREEIARLGVGRDRFRHPVGRKHHRRVGIVGDFGQFLDENGALGPQAVDHIAVVDDLVADIDRGPIDGQRPFHGVDRPHHPGAEAPRRTKHDFKGWFGLHGCDLGPFHPRRRAGNGQFQIRTWDWFRALSRPFSKPLRGYPRTAYIGPNSRHR